MFDLVGKKSVLVFSGLLTAFIFVVDLNTELGVAGGVPYIIVIALGLLYGDKKYFIHAGSLTIVLTLVGLGLSPAGGEAYKVFLNRFYAVASILIVSIMGFLIIRRKEEFESLKRNFDERLNNELELSKVLSGRQSALSREAIFNQAMQICLDNICKITQ